ncbi:Rv3654c family TadE-like protein, partial [Phytoactinopolyspora endophytica]|uniref:Rv3654c family TadE-like protein n=1 Tax=Phytoactinopolyspora endophytica TaxID=1642495 RepID=UPI00101CD2E6
VAALALAGILSAGQSARRQAAAAADLAALAAATHMDRDPATACTTAEAIAVANGAEMRSCVVDGREVEVQVRVLVTGTGSSWLPPQDRRARAGPR